MNHKVFLLLLTGLTPIIFAWNCKNNLEKKTETVIRMVNDQGYVINAEYVVGDARRYGVFPNSTNTEINPITGKPVIISLLDLAEKRNIEITFIAGDYPHDLNIKSRKNLKLNFLNTSFNALTISGSKNLKSSDINLRGQLVLFDRFGIHQANNVLIECLILKTDTTKNLSGLRSRGCHIYKGVSNLHINHLEIGDSGSGINKAYINTHAALVIDGMGDNPNSVFINKAIITSSDTHGAYITGDNHKIDTLVVYNFGKGTTRFMSKMQEAKSGQEHIKSGVWINRCNNCIFKNITVYTKNSPEGFPLKLDKGKPNMPTVIERLVLDTKYRDTLIIDELESNIIVKRIDVFENKIN